ncbi:hypothetical protein E2C01_056698 [Portunus trituberculatus]|uniref:Uncharacterized protein n=1 Tax=Portunus trituberculatus TaxID=210409 RepID=A0A5B7GYF5_PORTR|nr:hypothetical protein [Portunus trituberculatus]
MNTVRTVMSPIQFYCQGFCIFRYLDNKLVLSSSADEAQGATVCLTNMVFLLGDSHKLGKVLPDTRIEDLPWDGSHSHSHKYLPLQLGQPGFDLYAFLPLPLIRKVLNKLQASRNTRLILVAQYWP